MIIIEVLAYLKNDYLKNLAMQTASFLPDEVNLKQ